MTITNSIFVIGHPQRDGRCYVTERHTDHTGVVHENQYLAPDDIGHESVLAGNAISLAKDLALREFEDRLSRIGPLALQHQTAAQFANRLRRAFGAAVRHDAARIAWWLIESINAGHLTDAQVASAFGMTAPQYTNLKSTKLTPMHDRWAALLTDGGV